MDSDTSSPRRCKHMLANLEDTGLAYCLSGARGLCSYWLVITNLANFLYGFVSLGCREAPDAGVSTTELLELGRVIMYALVLQQGTSRQHGFAA